MDEAQCGNGGVEVSGEHVLDSSSVGCSMDTSNDTMGLYAPRVSIGLRSDGSAPHVPRALTPRIIRGFCNAGSGRLLVPASTLHASPPTHAHYRNSTVCCAAN